MASKRQRCKKNYAWHSRVRLKTIVLSLQIQPPPGRSSVGPNRAGPSPEGLGVFKDRQPGEISSCNSGCHVYSSLFDALRKFNLVNHPDHLFLPSHRRPQLVIMDSSPTSVDVSSSDPKTAIMNQVKQEAAMNNARQLISVHHPLLFNTLSRCLCLAFVVKLHSLRLTLPFLENK